MTIATRSDRFVRPVCHAREPGKITLSTPAVEDRFRTMITRFKPSHVGRLVFDVALLFVYVSNAEAQTGLVITEENFRAQQNGVLLGQVRAGVNVEILTEAEDWLQIELQGWVWTRSLQASNRRNFDLIVSASGGENLRGSPSGEVVGRLEEGVLLEEIGQVPGWTRVRRAVWMWRPSIELFGQQGGGPRPPSTVVMIDEDWIRAGSAGALILSSPDGDTLANAVPGAILRVLARDGNWARVRVDGWIWIPPGTGETGEEAVDADITVADIAAAPDEHRGRVIQWDLQFISLERAEKIRTDFYEGEPFLLTRTADAGGTFVYVAIPPERIQEAQGLSPLERIRVVGRLRTGSARLTGSPILELLSLTRISG